MKKVHSRFKVYLTTIFVLVRVFSRPFEEKMTSNDLMVLPDVQSSLDRRNIPIEKVGVKGSKPRF